jgi:hypothetical protein
MNYLNLDFPYRWYVINNHYNEKTTDYIRQGFGYHKSPANCGYYLFLFIIRSIPVCILKVSTA